MTEIRERVARCQRCGQRLTEHGEGCYDIRRSSFDVSQQHLMEEDRLVGELLAAIMQFRSVESIQNSTFAEEFFVLLDHRRQS